MLKLRMETDPGINDFDRQKKRFKCPKRGKEVKFYEVTVPSPDDKPPGGVVPEQLYREQRMIDLAKAIERYVSGGYLHSEFKIYLT